MNLHNVDSNGVIARDSGRKSKAWGASPRIRKEKYFKARETGDSRRWFGLPPAIAGCIVN